MLLDSYAWIEFLLGSEEGEKVKEVIQKEKCFTSIVSIAEINEWCLKNNLEIDFFVETIKKLSEIINLNEEIVRLAGKINFYNKKKIKGWGMLDSLIYTTARLYNLKVLTGDKHFKELEGVELL